MTKTNDRSSKRLTRREFIKSVAVGSTAFAGMLAGITVFSRETAQKAPSAAPTTTPSTSPLYNMYPGKVVMTRQQGVVDDNGSVHAPTVAEMLKKTLVNLSGEKDVRDAWRKLLRFEADDVIGIKINCIAGKNLSSNPALVQAVVDGLLASGIKPGNVVVWERTERELIRSGFTLNSSPGAVRYMGTRPHIGYDSENLRTIGRREIQLSRILTRHTSIMINLPILKDHGMSGVTLALKNHYGSFDIPAQFHSNNGDPWIAELNALPEIKNQTRLIVADVLRPICKGGPGDNPAFRWNYNGVMISTDPVAIDTIGLEILDQRRKEIDVESIAASNRAKHIQTAAALNLGIAKRDEITRVEV